MRILSKSASVRNGEPIETRAYNSESDRERAITQLRKAGRFNYFVPYCDTRSEFALYCSWAVWARPFYVCH